MKWLYLFYPKEIGIIVYHYPSADKVLKNVEMRGDWKGKKGARKTRERGKSTFKF